MLLPEKCRKDLLEVPEEIRNDLEFKFVSRMEEALNYTLGEENLKEARRKVALKKQAREAAAAQTTSAAQA